MTANKVLKRSYLYLAFIIAINSILKRYISGYLPLMFGGSGGDQLVLGLFNITLSSETLIYLIADVSNIVLLWLISKKILGGKYALVTTFVYAISPLVLYMGIYESVYLIGISGLNLLVLGFIYLKEKNNISYPLIIVGSLVMLSVGLSAYITGLAIILLALIYKFPDKISTKKLTKILLVLLFVLLVIFIIDPGEIKNEIVKANPFTEIGLVNSVNQFQGEQMEEGVFLYGRLIENRYTYYARHLFFTTLDHLSPVIYFAPQIKMFGYSFAPPILTGLLIPFLFGVYFLTKKLNRKSLSIILFILIISIPSILTKQSPDIEKLLLVIPYISIVASYGFKKSLGKNYSWLKILMIFSAVLIIGQLLFFLSDVALREHSRYIGVLDQR